MKRSKTQLQQLSSFSEDVWIATCARYGADIYRFIKEEADIDFPDEVFPTLLPEYLRIYKAASSVMRSELWRVAPKLESGYRSKIRVYKDPQKRQELRERKHHIRWPVQVVFESVWNAVPDSFVSYARNNMVFDQQIAKVREQANRYRQLGCDEMAQQIDDDLLQCQARIDKHGFHKIPLLDAALINAKQCGMLGMPYEEDKWVRIAFAEDQPAYMPCLSPAEPPAELERLFDHFIIMENKVLLGERDGKCYYISEGESYETLSTGK